MSKFLRAAAVVCLPAVLLVGTASGQDDKKKDAGKSRLPNFWKQLDLSDKQKEEFYKMAGAREAQVDALKTDIAELQSKLNDMKKKLKELEDGEAYQSILTSAQKEKLAKLRAESMKKSAEKAMAKAKDMEKGKTKTTTKTEKKTETKDSKKTDKKDEKKSESKDGAKTP